MGRLKPEFLERVESFGDRVLDVVEALEAQGRSRRVLDQLTGCGTAVGANLFEADEALSRPDFNKCVGIAVKELNESRYWLRLIARRKWIAAKRLESIAEEAIELKKILGAILWKSRRGQRSAKN